MFQAIPQSLPIAFGIVLATLPLMAVPLTLMSRGAIRVLGWFLAGYAGCLDFLRIDVDPARNDHEGASVDQGQVAAVAPVVEQSRQQLHQRCHASTVSRVRSHSRRCRTPDTPTTTVSSVCAVHMPPTEGGRRTGGRRAIEPIEDAAVGHRVR